MREQPIISDEILQVRQTLFKDYLNARDKIQRSANAKTLELTKAQEERVLAIARKHYRKREVSRNTTWFRRFVHNVDAYYDSIKLGNWGSFRDR